jgi:hypothetical protein
MCAGCQRTVYVCDDGKDKFKRRMCQRMGREVIATPLPHRSPLQPHPIDACLLACQSMCRLSQGSVKLLKRCISFLCSSWVS